MDESTATARLDSAPGGTALLGGRPIARVGFGAMQLAFALERGTLDETAAANVLRRALDGGVDHLDTAQFYAAGAANRLIASVLRPHGGPRRDDVLVATKVGAFDDPRERLVVAQRPEQLRASVEANLRSLATDRLDLVDLRRLDMPPGLKAEGDQIVDLDAQLAELIAMRDEGLIGEIGLSNVSAQHTREAIPAGVVSVQNAFSLVSRDTAPVLEVCREHGLAWIPFFPLGSGFPQAPKVIEQPAAIAVADRLGVTPAQVGLAWLLAQYDRTFLIPGTTSTAHLEESLAVGEVRLDAQALRELDALAAGPTAE